MKKPIIFASIIFLACLWTGFDIARHKALWNDEYFSEVASINGTSYADQFTGNMPKAEGGNAPLFYALQKLALQLIHYQMPSAWQQGHWSSDVNSQLLLRIVPVIFMSLSVSLVFYYFYRRYSVWTGLYSLFIYLSSYMLWAYWAEARPYALLVFLTTVQSVILLKKIDQLPQDSQKNLWLMLAGTNMLLALTSTLSLGEILAGSGAWWLLKERDWRKYLLITVAPVLIAMFYFAHAIKLHFYFGLSPEQLIRDNISRERFDFLFIFIIGLIVYWGGTKKQWFKYYPGKDILSPGPYVIFMALVLASCAALLILLGLHAKQNIGFPITSRYFIYLTPIGVIASTLMTMAVVKSMDRYRLMQAALAGLFVLLFVQRFLKVWPKIIYFIVGG